jgi:hypothetical protein
VTPSAAHAQGENLALAMSVTRSSDCSCGRAASAVDGNVATYWQPLAADRTDDSNVWLRVDLGATASIERAVLNFRAGLGDIIEFRIRTSNDELSWQTVYVKHRELGAIESVESADFDAVIARYVRLDVTLATGGSTLQLNELELHGTPATRPRSGSRSAAIEPTIARSGFASISAGRRTSNTPS